MSTKEKSVGVGVAETVKSVVESVKAIGKETTTKKPGTPGDRKEEHVAAVEAVLQGVAIRIALTSNFKDLGKTLEETLTVMRAGGQSPVKFDQLRGRVLDTVVKIKGQKQSELLVRFLEERFKKGEYEQAAQYLKTLVDDSKTDMPQAKKNELNQVLAIVKPEATTTDAELQTLKTKGKDVKDENEDLIGETVKKSDEVESELVKHDLELVRKDVAVVPEPTERTVTEQRRNDVNAEGGTMKGKLEDDDIKFVSDVLLGQAGSGDRRLDFATMDRKAVYHIWYRTSGILQRPMNWGGGDNTRMLLEEINASAREAILGSSREGLVLQAMTPSEARFLALPVDEQRLVQNNLDFIGGTRGDWRELLRMQDGMGGDEFASRGLERETITRTDVAMRQLINEYAQNKPDFHLEKKLRQNKKTNKWEWGGTREELYDVCREEVYGIQGQLTQENMSQLVFEESAQKYLALMRIDVGDDLELEKVKDAITKNLYIEFAVKTMWRSGGNIEAWQRAASVLTQESQESFFELMQIGEMLKVKNAEGKEIEIGRYNWEDLMSLAETKAKNGQYWLTYMAGQSGHLQTERQPEFAATIAELVIKKNKLSGKMDDAAERKLRADIAQGGFSFSKRQTRSMVDYMQFMEVATLRAGEFGLNQSLVPGKFEFTDLPCGEAAQKIGPWSVIYDWYYPVTKYGGEWVGKIFLPNVNVLSYRRSETLGHFLAVDDRVVAGMRDKDGEFHATGIGAKEFFFGGVNAVAVDAGGNQLFELDGAGNQTTKGRTVAGDFCNFWGDVIFDTRTGGISEAQQKASIKNKNSINRTVDMIREKAAEKMGRLRASNDLGFVENMDFTNFETLVGHPIPGANKMAKFEWMVQNFDYSFWRKDVLKSKGVGDWVNKYVPKKYEASRLKLADFLNAPGMATAGALRDNISEYSDESGINEMTEEIIKENRKSTLGWRRVNENGNEDPNGTLKLVGYKDADRNKSKWTQEGAGDFFGVTEQWHSPTEGYHWGAGFPTSRQQGKELFRDPMYFEKMEIDNQFHAGMLSRQEWGEAKREWQSKVYLGEPIVTIGKLRIRPGHTIVLAPFFLFRGWWVDRMQLDWEDFLIAFSKNNDKAWEKLKKIIGI